jgi:small subunit ribosomal protein S6
MKDYELSFLFHPDLEMNQDPAIDKVKKLIKSAGGNIKNEENEGKKRLAYPINGHTFALYYYADVELPSDAPDKISSSMNINDEIIRYLLVRTDPRKAKYAAIRAESGQDEAASDEDQTNSDTTNQEEDK